MTPSTESSTQTPPDNSSEQGLEQSLAFADRSLAPGSWRLKPELDQAEQARARQIADTVGPPLRKCASRLGPVAVLGGLFMVLGVVILVLIICLGIFWTKWGTFKQGFACVVGIGFLVIFYMAYEALNPDEHKLQENKTADPRNPDYRVDDWKDSVRPEPLPPEKRNVLGVRLAVALGIGLLFFLGYAGAVYSLQTDQGGFIPSFLIDIVGIGLSLGCVIAVVLGTDYPYTEFIVFPRGGLYAKLMQDYAKNPLTMAQYLSDLDPWTNVPMKGTLSNWRLGVFAAGLPDQVDEQQYLGIEAAFVDERRPYRKWWQETSATLRAEAESRAGELHTCPNCRGQRWFYIGTCEKCKGQGRVQIEIARKLVGGENIPTDRGTVMHREFQVTYRWIECPTCKGHGAAEKKPCEECHALGKVAYTPREVYYVHLRSKVYEKAKALFP